MLPVDPVMRYMSDPFEIRWVSWLTESRGSSPSPGKLAVAVAISARRATGSGEGEADNGVGAFGNRVAVSVAQVGGGHSGVRGIDADCREHLCVADRQHVDRGLGSGVER